MNHVAGSTEAEAAPEKAQQRRQSREVLAGTSDAEKPCCGDEAVVVMMGREASPPPLPPYMYWMKANVKALVYI